jgi:PIN domain nuclease of toxin-antitoxin system
MIEKNLVLDTCALLWLVSGDDHLSKSSLDAIERAFLVYVSSISAWEISLKHSRGDLVLPMEARAWFEAAMEKHSLTAVPVDIAIACRANSLPPHHKDPADRMIIATALELSAAVVSADRNFEKYGIRVLS